MNDVVQFPGGASAADSLRKRRSAADSLRKRRSAPDVPDEDGYAGPAQLINGDDVVAVQVKLAGHFDPISGKYNWYGRVAVNPEVTGLVETGVRKVTLRTPHAEVATMLSDVDPWGRPRVEGFGASPFPVLDHLPDDAD
ncbi:MAG: DUF4873 domain-containing protein [Jatrophihabitans sp.]